MKLPWKHWLPVALYLGTTVAVALFGFVPFHRQASEESLRARGLATDLDLRIARIESMPAKQGDLKRLQLELGRFKSSLSSTDEVDRVMRAFRSRAEAAGLELWILNPSVPVLLQLDAGVDSLSRLDLAVLPIVFECRGPFKVLATFLEAEESRTDFVRWHSLSCTAQPAGQLLHARGEMDLFLLPAAGVAEASL